MSPKTSAKVPTATTPEDNGYCPQSGAYDRCYSGDLNEVEHDDEERDAKLDAARSQFAHQDKPSKPEAWD